MIHLYPRQEMSHARETLPGQFQPAVKRAALAIEWKE
jgi:hypothetical protein